MNDYKNKTLHNENQSLSGKPVKRESNQILSSFVDNRPEAITQTKLRNALQASPQNNQIAQLQAVADMHTASPSLTRKEEESATPDNWYVAQPKQKVAAAPMRTVQMNQSSSAPVAQLKAVKTWHYYTSTLDVANPKQKFQDVAAVQAWEAALPAPAAPAPAAPAPAPAPAAPAPAAPAPAVPAQAPAAAPVIGIRNGMTEHYMDHRDGGLPRDDNSLIQYVTDHYKEFVPYGGRWKLSLGTMSTRRDAGDWSQRSWSIIVDGNDEIRHYGPLG